MSEAEFCFLPLGGCAEIGMNLNAYAYGPADDREWLVIDVGVTFGNEQTPGIDLIMADPAFLADQKIRAIILTHAHEDHIGAIAHLWRYLRAPVYASAFTARLVRIKLAEEGLEGEVPLHVFAPGDTLELDPFQVRCLSLTHSIPEMNALAIRTPAGCVFHTGDWKIDADPVVGSAVNEQDLRALGDEGVLAMVCDSTNVFVEGEAGSENSVRETLIELIAGLQGRVAVAGFASNVARLTSVCEAANRAGRKVSLIGRSMIRIAEAARSVGLLNQTHFIAPEVAQQLDADSVLYLCTGSQGEPRAALARIASGSHPHVKLEAGDTVIFSSRIIPGNEKAIAHIQNALAVLGVNLITESQACVHVSGHPCRDELSRMYSWIRPEISVPVHGERRHCLEHANFAKSLQIKQAIAPDNGDMVLLAPGSPAIIEQVQCGRLMLDGLVLTSTQSAGLKERRRMARDGHIVVAVAIDEQGRLSGGPELSLRGYSEADASSVNGGFDALQHAAERALDHMSPADLRDDKQIKSQMVRALRRAGERVFGKRPMVDLIVVYVE